MGGNGKGLTGVRGRGEAIDDSWSVERMDGKNGSCGQVVEGGRKKRREVIGGNGGDRVDIRKGTKR